MNQHTTHAKTLTVIGCRWMIPLLLCILIARSSQAESLRVVEQYELGKYYGVFYALRAGGDTVMFIAHDGLYLQGNKDEECHMVMERASSDVQVPFSLCDSNRLTRLVSPEGLWQYKSDKGNEVLIFEGHCNRMYRLSQTDEGTPFLTRCDKRTGYDFLGNANVQGGSMLAAMSGNDTEKRIVIQKIGSSNFLRLFRCSEELLHWRDSVSLAHSYLGYPAINPQDSTIWLAVDGYPYVYLVDMAGELRDSVPITNADYRRPPQTISRIESQAVTNEWYARWTPVMFFSYVYPDYFIMQYRVGDGICMGEDLSQLTTVVWNVNKQVVPLKIDPLWRLAGVQDDGRIIFVAREADNSGCKETLVVARIEP
ncbi:MAG: hypothetical protein IPH75_12260 [bacterium]|nr:hypothetical protein [bacterium]